MVGPADFVNIHEHTEYSLLDGKTKIPDLVKRAKELGQCAAGCTDHGNTYGLIEFYDECKKGGIKPILGTEFYFLEKEVGEDEKKVRPNSHITVIAMNAEGVRSINILTTRAASRFFYKPYITMKDFREVNTGLIVTSGCFASLISQAILNDNNDKALELIRTFKEIFGDRFYIEVQDSGVPGQPKITKQLREWSRTLNIPRFVSNDSHYARPDDAFAHSIMLAINTGTTMSEKPIYEGGRRFAFSKNEYYMKSAEELSKEGWEDGEILCSRAIADRCDVMIEKKMKLPVYPKLPAGVSSMDFLKSLCRTAWKDKKISSRGTQRYLDRINKEFADIESGGIADYFLIVQDYMAWARSEGIPVGPGRGSAAGSLVGYLLGITEIDPLKYGLYWERFWNAGRAKGGLPDIDCDFSQDKRGLLLKYIKGAFGEKRVLPIITFNRMTSKLVLKDVGRTLGISPEDMNEVTRFVPHKVDSLEDAIERSPELKELAENKYKMVFEVSKDLQETVRNTGTHASAIVVLSSDIDSGDIPASYDSKSKSLIAGYDMYTLDNLKYMKMDCLGLKTLDTTDIASDLIVGRS